VRGAWILLGLAACGRLGFDPTPPGATHPDAPADGPGLLGPPLLMVDPTTLPPFGAPQLVPGLSVAGSDDDDPCLTRDQLEIIFDRSEPNHDLYSSRRASINDPWPTPTPILELNTNASEEHPSFSGDGLRLHFTSGRTGGAEMYVATRADRDSPWENVQLLAEVNSDEYDASGSTSADERVLVFSSWRGGLTVDELFESRRDHPGQPWGAPIAIVELNTASAERGAHLDDHGMVMYFEQNVRLVWTQRGPDGVQWNAPQVITELDLPSQAQTDPWLSPDLRTIYYTLGTGTGTQDIYMATR
jgi:hypothetical protein